MEETKLSEKLEGIIKSIEQLTVLELAELVKAFEERFGVTAIAPVQAGVAVPGQSTPAGEAVEEKTTFDVILAEVGADKIKVIKEIRAITNLGLKEAKDLVDTAPKPIKTGVPKEEAQNIKKKLEEVGAKIELK
ncbi:MAG: 50S ribosomal protein L7/L12 [Candidatus Omnitrophica bacterium]|nr:50S ribosomal protein L7/L12 [Candidatus Omnitrophota bacterium]MCM8799014.1 50S ribosomal protein L7/L12 [Candidatus Omnitrophota bacterium]